MIEKDNQCQQCVTISFSDRILNLVMDECNEFHQENYVLNWLVTRIRINKFFDLRRNLHAPDVVNRHLFNIFGLFMNEDYLHQGCLRLWSG